MKKKKLTKKQPDKIKGIQNMKNELDTFMSKYGITEIQFGSHSLKKKTR
jgi:hypothetical protein